MNTRREFLKLGVAAGVAVAIPLPAIPSLPATPIPVLAAPICLGEIEAARLAALRTLRDDLECAMFGAPPTMLGGPPLTMADLKRTIEAADELLKEHGSRGTA